MWYAKGKLNEMAKSLIHMLLLSYTAERTAYSLNTPYTTVAQYDRTNIEQRNENILWKTRRRRRKCPAALPTCYINWFVEEVVSCKLCVLWVCSLQRYHPLRNHLVSFTLPSHFSSIYWWKHWDINFGCLCRVHGNGKK